ncbi:Differentially expressed in FDCP 8 [Manis javanica]|nr:Differentially expressed in FDCP 8 [Manis javanica]
MCLIVILWLTCGAPLCLCVNDCGCILKQHSAPSPHSRPRPLPGLGFTVGNLLQDLKIQPLFRNFLEQGPLNSSPNALADGQGEVQCPSRSSCLGKSRELWFELQTKFLQALSRQIRKVFRKLFKILRKLPKEGVTGAGQCKREN